MANPNYDYSSSIGLRYGEELRSKTSSKGQASTNKQFLSDLKNPTYKQAAREIGITKLDSSNDLSQVLRHLQNKQATPAPAPAPAPPPISTGGSAAAQATANTAATAEQTYRASIPKVEMGAIRPGTSWDTLENGRYIAPYEGGSRDDERNRPIDTSNSNFATKAMTEYGARIQDNFSDFIDSLKADALNNSAQMGAVDDRNMSQLRPDLALKNPGEELRRLYGEISDNMRSYV